MTSAMPAGLPRRERRDPPQRRAEQRGARHAADEALDGLRRRQQRRDLVAAEQLAPDILQHVARLHDQHQEGDQQQVAALVAGDRQGQQRRHVREQNTQIISPHCTSATRA